MYIFMATFIGLIMNSKCQQTLVNLLFKMKKVIYFLVEFYHFFLCENFKNT